MAIVPAGFGGMDAAAVAKLEARNMRRYGNPIGKSVDAMLNDGKTLEGILESAVETNF